VCEFKCLFEKFAAHVSLVVCKVSPQPALVSPRFVQKLQNKSMGQLLTSEAVINKLPVSRLNKYRIGYLKAGGHPLLGVSGIPNPRLTAILVTVIVGGMYLVPLEMMKQNLKSDMQGRVDERKMREGMFALQMLEYFDDDASKTNPTRELLTVRRGVMKSIEPIPGYTTMIEMSDDDDKKKSNDDSGDNGEEELVDVERWPHMFEQRHSLFYRNQVRRKMQQVQAQIEELEGELLKV